MSGNGDTVVVAWMESSGGNPEILLRYSFTGVADLWTHPVVNVTELATGQQSFPDLLWKNGAVHLVWQDEATNQVVYRRAEVGIPAGLGNAFEGSWTLYPNPAKDRVTLDALPSADCTLSLMDIRGQLLYRMELSHKHRAALDLAGVEAGVYFLQLTSDGVHLGTKKLVVQR